MRWRGGEKRQETYVTVAKRELCVAGPPTPEVRPLENVQDTGVLESMQDTGVLANDQDTGGHERHGCAQET